MGTRKALLATGTLAAALLLLAAASASAQESPGQAGGAAPSGGPAAKTYYFILDDRGEPIFTQVLRWDADPNALEYRLVVEDSSGAATFDGMSSEARAELHLSPGRYRYKVVTYNLLDQPEAESSWTTIDITKAEQPVIVSSSPSTIYMDTLDGRVTISGAKLLAGGRVEMKSRQTGTSREGAILQLKGDAEAVVLFPDDAYVPGDYDLYFEDPGGLSATLDDALRVKFQRPVDLLVSIGWTPLFPLGDSWARSAWPEAFDAAGLDAGLDLYFVKQRWGFIGAELGVARWRLLGGDTNASLTSDFVLYGADMLYEYRVSRRLHAIARLGGGLAWSCHSFDYAGFPGPTARSSDPFLRLGLAVEGFLPNKLFGEIGADWTSVFFLNDFLWGISPVIRIGYQVY